MAIGMLHSIQSKKFLGLSLRRNQRMLDIPKGHLAVYVGLSDKKRIVIPVSYLSQPLFQDLLSRAEEEFEFDHPMGGITIPCDMDVFISVMSQLDLV